MVEQKENIGFRIIETVLAVIFILFALSYLNGNENNYLNRTKHNISNEVILSQENAIVSTEFQLVSVHNQEFSKLKFPEEKIISIINAQNRMNDFLILLQRNTASEKAIGPVFACFRHVFPPEKDEVPLAS
jgi:hypothetical protein